MQPCSCQLTIVATVPHITQYSKFDTIVSYPRELCTGLRINDIQIFIDNILTVTHSDADKVKEVVHICGYAVGFCEILWRHPVTSVIKMIKGASEYIKVNDVLVVMLRSCIEVVSIDGMDTLLQKLKLFSTQYPELFREYEKDGLVYAAFSQTDLIDYLESTIHDVKNNILILGGKLNVNVSHVGVVRRSIILPLDQLYSATPNISRQHSSNIVASNWTHRRS